MGIMAPLARAILQEHKFRPISGDGLLIGRQTVPLTLAQARTLLGQEGIEINPNFDPDAPWVMDKDTRASKGHGYISDRGFFAMFSDVRLQTLDVTDYEDADIIHDMHIPVPDRMAEQFDFIWNGSCLDNMFDPATAMKSTARMLKPGGRAICMEMLTNHFEAYVTFSPAWFFDYFALNEFADCKVYTCAFAPRNLWKGPFHLFATDKFEDKSLQFNVKRLPRGYAVMTICVAEKAANSTWDKMPIQGQYRPDHEPYKRAFEKFQEAQRPMLDVPMPVPYPKYWKFMRNKRHKYLGVMYGVD